MTTIEEEAFPAAFAPESAPYGVTYSEWTARWWQWALKIPRNRNPISDTTGKNSAEGQTGSDPVWFLAGTLGGMIERACEIPAGKAILFPVSNNESSYIEFPDLTTELELRACSKADIDKVTRLMVAIDGVELKELDLKSYRIQSPLFSVTLPEDSIFGVTAGTTQAVSDGYWMFLKPLPPGRHHIHFMGSCITDALRIEAKYEIDVKEIA